MEKKLIKGSKIMKKTAVMGFDQDTQEPFVINPEVEFELTSAAAEEMIAVEEVEEANFKERFPKKKFPKKLTVLGDAYEVIDDNGVRHVGTSEQMDAIVKPKKVEEK